MEAQTETAAPGGAPETADKNECTLAQYSTPLTLVVFEADRPITKTLRLDGDGELEKKTPPQMARGKARRYRLENVGEFVEMLEFLEPRHALAFGAAQHALVMTEALYGAGVEGPSLGRPCAVGGA